MNDSYSRELQEQQQTAVKEKQLKEPRLYKVLIFNDDYTTMDFVITVLQKFFNMSFDKATTVMWTVHTTGKGVCGIFTYDVAETKVFQVNEYARKKEFPLLCLMEPV